MKRNAKFPLPGSGYPQLMEIIRAYSVWGEEIIGAKKLHENLLKKFATSDISRNSKFLVTMGIIEGIQVGNEQGYRVTKSGFRLGVASADNNLIEVSKTWRQLIDKQSFFDKVLNTIKFSGFVNKGDLKTFIVTESGNELTGHSFDQHAVTVIEILKAAHLVVESSRYEIKIRQESSSSGFINLDLINLLEKTESDFDCSRLIRYCEEINDNYERGNYASVGFLSRAIVDHIPPIFNQKSFAGIAAQVSGERHTSFKKSCEALDKSLKNIVDRSIHKQINSADIPPFKEEINFSQDLNTVLARVVEELSKGSK